MISLLILLAESIRAGTDVTAYGTILGTNKGTTGYSNGNTHHISEEYNEDEDTFYGMKWQCVEYSRRWLIEQYKISFGRVEGAADIWSLEGFVYVRSSENASIEKVENGSTCKPEVGNVLIYERAGSEIPFGHVAIIVDVSEFGVKLAEQNWKNDYWPGDYSRELNFTISEGKYYLFDGIYPIIGWIEYANTYSSCTKLTSSASNNDKPAPTKVYLI